jgi:uncharacterized protein
MRNIFSMHTHYPKIFIILLYTFFHYKIAKLLQIVFLSTIASSSYQITLGVAWIIAAVLPIFLFRSYDWLYIDRTRIVENKKEIMKWSICIVLGVGMFVLLGVTKYFHTVRYPILFFFVTPLVEESLFRGWIFDVLQRQKRWSPVVLTALLFGFQHLQYFNYIPSLFALFQITYTFILGLLLGRVRLISGNFYISLGLHILVNFITVYY